MEVAVKQNPGGFVGLLVFRARGGGKVNYFVSVKEMG